MCRIAAYLGPELDLNTLLTAAPHSLYRQSWAPREMETATVNADGWGVGWLDRDGIPAVYTNTQPIWADRNLDSLGRSLRSRVWVGNVRSATPGLGTHDVNTQPYSDARWLFVHNGFITDFAHTLRRAVRAQLGPELDASIEGNTDSEHVFALMRQQGGAPDSALAATLAWLCERLRRDGVTALLNIVLSDGESLVASRAAVGLECPSLYWHAKHDGFGSGALIASEPFDEDSGWNPVPPRHVITLQPGRQPCLTALDKTTTAA